MSQQVHVSFSDKDGVVDAVGIPAVREKLLAKDEPFNPSKEWFDKAPSEKKPFGVYDVVDIPVTPQRFQRHSYGQPKYEAIDDGVYRYPSYTDYTLEEAKTELLGDLAAKRYDVEIGGTALANGLRVGTDERTRSALNLAMIQIGNGRTKSVNWKTEINGQIGFQSLDVATIELVYEALTAHIEASFDREKALADEVNAAASVDALRAIDLEAGWPS